MTYVAVAELDPVLAADLLAAAAGQPYSGPSVWYVAALTALPTSATDLGVECTAGDYVRVPVSPQTLMALVSGTWQSVSDISFATATADWPEAIVAICAFDDDVAGQRQWFTPFAAPVPIVSGSALRIPAGALIFQPGS